MKSAGPSIGIYDATNTTKDRRKTIYKYLTSIPGLHVLFVESICTDPDVIDANIKEVKVSSPDYQDVDNEEAIQDFKKRIKYYESLYEPIDIHGDRDLPFLKIFNLGSKFIANNINNHMQSRIIYYYMNIRVLPRVIYITRPGERVFDVKGFLGDDKELSERGIQYSKALASYIGEHKEMKDVVVWTSLMASDNQTTNHLKSTVTSITKLKSLNELDAGSFERMTYDDVKNHFPEEYSIREVDKYYYRFPAGESYQDLVVRLEPIIMELEKVTNVLVVCQQAVARCLISYLTDKPREDTPYIDIPLHTLFKLTPVAYGCKMEKISFGISGVSNYRPKPAGLVSSKSFDESRLRRKLSVSTIGISDNLSISPPISLDPNSLTKENKPTFNFAC